MLQSPVPVVLNAIAVSPNIILKAIPHSCNLEAIHPPLFVVLESIAPPPLFSKYHMLPTYATPPHCCSGCHPPTLLFWMPYPCSSECYPFITPVLDATYLPMLLIWVHSLSIVLDAIPKHCCTGRYPFAPVALDGIYFPALIFRVQSHFNCSGSYPQPLFAPVVQDAISRTLLSWMLYQPYCYGC
jgi:hypothetical protein